MRMFNRAEGCRRKYIGKHHRGRSFSVGKPTLSPLRRLYRPIDSRLVPVAPGRVDYGDADFAFRIGDDFKT